jgi:anhydro-N-acetylmuramic acid kinase
MDPIWAVGLMTGTVLDGNIDVALIRTDGETVSEFGPWTLSPYPPGLSELLHDTLQQARAWNFGPTDPAIFAEAEDALTRAQSAAVRQFVEASGMRMADIGIVGFHGQSVLHRAPTKDRIGDTRQLGDGALMAELLGTKVAYDFRSADVRAGGQGAPLAASYHATLLRDLGATGDVAVLNLGGVANVTWTDGAQVIAFDTGPANAPINDWVRAHTGGAMDADGALAKSGTVDETRLAQLLQHAYLSAPYPKSLDRFDFEATMADGLSLADGAATLTAITACAVGKGLDLLPQLPKKIIVCGGGRRNPVIMEMLARRAKVEAVPAETVGWRGDAIEAELFAFLAVRRLRNLPISFPTTTGVPAPMNGARLVE